MSDRIELEERYIKAGGDLADFKSLELPEIETVVESREELLKSEAELEAEETLALKQAAAGYIPQPQPKPPTLDDLIQSLEELETADGGHAFGDPEFYEHEQQVRDIQNQIRSQLGMAELPKIFTDNELLVLLKLDGGDIKGIHTADLLAQFGNNKGFQANLRHRLTELADSAKLSSARAIEKAQEEERIKLAWSSVRAAPQRYIEDDKRLVLSPKWETWRDEAKRLQSRIKAKIRADENVERELGEKADKRRFYYQIDSKLSELLEQQEV